MVWAALTAEQQAALDALPRLSYEAQAAAKDAQADVSREKRAVEAAGKTKAANFDLLNQRLTTALRKSGSTSGARCAARRSCAVGATLRAPRAAPLRTTAAPPPRPRLERGRAEAACTPKGGARGAQRGGKRATKNTRSALPPWP